MAPMITAEGLGRAYGRALAVRDLTFTVARGEVMGLLGPNGAGKSTTLRMLATYLPPSCGSAAIAGMQLGREDAAIRRIIGYLPEHAPSYGELDVDTFLTHIGRLHRLGEGTIGERLTRFAELCGLTEVRHRRIQSLSKGYRQRVGLAAALLHEPQCLLLDEPGSGLDPNQNEAMRQLIRQLSAHATILLSSHHLADVAAVCGRVMIVDRGELTAIGTPAELALQAGGGVRFGVRLRGEAAALLEAVQRRLPEAQVVRDSDRLLFHHPDTAAPLAEAIFHAAVECGAVLLELRREEASLEQLFRRLTGGEA